MDTFTQGLLGAVIGQALFRVRLGRAAIIWGFIGGVLPDFDLLAGVVAGPVAGSIIHRGPTHSLPFAVLVAPVLGYISWRWQRHRARVGRQQVARDKGPGGEGQWPFWALLWLLVLVGHDLLSWATSYGTLLLWPFSMQRFALDAMPIVEPIYTLLLALALVPGLRRDIRRPLAQIVAAATLAVTTGYVLMGWHLNAKAVAVASQQMAADGVAAEDVRAYPTNFQLYLRRVIARRGAEIRVGFLSLWRAHPIAWQNFEQTEHPAQEALATTREGKTLRWVTRDQVYTRLGRHEDQGGVRLTAEIGDLRFGVPGPPDRGAVGWRAGFSEDGEMLSPPRYFRRRAPLNLDAIRWSVPMAFRPDAGD